MTFVFQSVRFLLSICKSVPCGFCEKFYKAGSVYSKNCKHMCHVSFYVLMWVCILNFW